MTDLNDNKSVSDISRNFKFNLYWCNNLEISIVASKNLKYNAKMVKEHNQYKSQYNDEAGQYTGTPTVRLKVNMIKIFFNIYDH